VAKADQQPAPNFVPLKAVCDALENRAGESVQGVKRFVVQGMASGDLRYCHRGSVDPPSSFFRGYPDSFIFDGSDMINPVVEDGYAYRLRGVSLAWEDVIATNSALRDIELPQLGMPRFEVSLAVPLMQLVRRFAAPRRRPAPLAEAAPVKKPLRKRNEALDWLLEKKERDPPKHWKKLEWCRERLKEGPKEFVEGEFPWSSAESIVSKLNDLIAGRLVRDLATGHVVLRSQLKK